MQKYTGGFSYIEMLVAMGLFLLVLLAVLSFTAATGQNLRTAREIYQKSLAANGIALYVRDMLLRYQEINKDSIHHAANRFSIKYYAVYIFDANGNNILGTHENNKPVFVYGFDELALSKGGFVIFVVTKNSSLHPVGRAVHIALKTPNGDNLIWRYVNEAK